MTLLGESKTEDEEVFFTGKPRVYDLGYAFLFRNYRSSLGKWQTADPLGYPDGWNNKAYCNSRASNLIDPLGLVCNCSPGDGDPTTIIHGCGIISATPWILGEVTVDLDLISTGTTASAGSHASVTVTYFSHVIVYDAPCEHCGAEGGTREFDVDVTTSTYLDIQGMPFAANPTSLYGVNILSLPSSLGDLLGILAGELYPSPLFTTQAALDELNGKIEAAITSSCPPSSQLPEVEPLHCTHYGE